VKDIWKLMRAVFIICSSMGLCQIGVVLAAENTKMFTAALAIIGLIGIITGIVMGGIVLVEHAQKSAGK